jgi:hypothetical protein
VVLGKSRGILGTTIADLPHPDEHALSARTTVSSPDEQGRKRQRCCCPCGPINALSLSARQISNDADGSSLDVISSLGVTV